MERKVENIIDTAFGRFSYKQQNLQRFAFGSFLHQTDLGNQIIAEPLKALADKVWFDKRFKPTSSASYASYLFDDLRVEENALFQFINVDFINEIIRIYSSRKITWLMFFLLRWQKEYE